LSVWLAIGLVVIGLVGVALVVLIFDVARGDVGGHHTMARARRLLIVANDETGHAEAERWAAEQHAARPDMQLFVLVKPEGQELYEEIFSSLERDRPDGIVMFLSDRHSTTFERVREQTSIPVDVIDVQETAPA
jgi:hypothetical protein